MASKERTGETDEYPGGITLTFLVQPPVSGPRSVIMDRLTRLKVEGAIEDYTIELVEGEIILSEGGEDREATGALADLGRVVRWERGDISSTLEIRQTRSRMGRTVQKLVLPEMVIVVRHGGKLVGVFPCSSGEEEYSVTDFLDSYEASGAFPPGSGLSLPSA